MSEDQTGWDNISLRLKSKIIKNMDSATRQKLSMCSRVLWNNHVKRLDFLYKIFIKKQGYSDPYYEVELFTEDREDGESYITFIRPWEKEDGFDTSEDDEDEVDQTRNITKIISRSYNYTEKIVNGDPFTNAVNYFNELLLKHHKHLNAIQIKIDKPFMLPMKIEKFPYLKSLEVEGLPNFPYFFDKLPADLEYLTIKRAERNVPSYHFTDIVLLYEQIFEFNGTLSLTDTDIEYHQFLKLKAKNMELSLKSISPISINGFIHSWINGDIREDFEVCRFQPSYETPLFNFEIILDGLDGIEINSENYEHSYWFVNPTQVFRVLHKTNPNKFMDIVITSNKYQNYLILAVNNEKQGKTQKKPNHICNVNFCCQKPFNDKKEELKNLMNIKMTRRYEKF